MIPSSLQQHLNDKLNATIHSAQPASGGSINHAARVTIDSHGPCFLKWNQHHDADMFVKEVKGLKLLRSADTGLVIPGVILQGTEPESGTGYLLMDFIEEESGESDSAQRFGRELARMHQTQNNLHGLDHDNYIGRLPQYNDQHERWVDFFIEQRMQPQLRMAMDQRRLASDTSRHFENMYQKLPDIFPEEPPSLLHGDLWGGNYFFTSGGRASIYDPAVYFGSREMELAFTHMFGGFSPDFYQGYEEVWPLEPGFSERKDLYNLYHLLTHTNMFGGSYGRQVESIVSRF